MYRFPHEVAYLPQTKLSYVNLPGILSDGKRDRTARVPGFVAVQLGDRCHLIFLRQGEPFQAARIGPEGHAQVALAEVLRIAGTESERGENGRIAYYGAPEEQLRAMLATFLHPSVPCGEGVEPGKPDHLFPALRERRFSGVVELCDARVVQYLVFRDGAYRTGYFCERDSTIPVGDFLRSLFRNAGSGLRVSLYPALDQLLAQASPGLVDLYRRIVGGVVREASAPVGREAGMGLVRLAQEAAAARYPPLAAFVLTENGRVRGDPVAPPRLLTEAVAAWVSEALIAASEQYGLDPAETLSRVTHDSRFVLTEEGFFALLPWAVPV